MKVDGIGSADISGSIQKKQVNEDKSFEDVLRKAYSEGDKEKLKEACKEFEGLFMQMMYKQMKKTVPKSQLIPESTGREIFEDMLDEEIINNAKERGIGLADVLYRQLSLTMDKTFTVQNEKSK